MFFYFVVIPEKQVEGEDVDLASFLPIVKLMGIADNSVVATNLFHSLCRFANSSAEDVADDSQTPAAMKFDVFKQFIATWRNVSQDRGGHNVSQSLASNLEHRLQ